MNAITESAMSTPMTDESVPRLPHGADYLLRKAMEVFVEVVKGGKHAAHNAAILRNRIDRYLQLIAQRTAAPDVESELLECLCELLDCQPEESPIWDARKWENACNRSRAIVEQLTP